MKLSKERLLYRAVVEGALRDLWEVKNLPTIRRDRNPWDYERMRALFLRTARYCVSRGFEIDCERAEINIKVIDPVIRRLIKWGHAVITEEDQYVEQE